MRFSAHRAGRIAVQTIIVGTATLIGGATSIPWMMRDGEKSSTAPISVLSEMAMVPMTSSEEPTSESLAFESPAFDLHGSGQSTHGALPPQEDFMPSAVPMTSPEVAIPPPLPSETSSESFAQTESSIPRPTFAIDVDEPATEPPGSEKKVKHVRVFYATDRQRYEASNAHLWITSIAPSLLGVSITCVMFAGCFAGRRRWAWAIGTCLCLIVSYVLMGQSIIKVGQLVRLAKVGSSWFGSDRFESATNYPLNLGTSDVTLPPNHRKGEIERPSVFTFEFEEREDRHVMVQFIKPLDADSFFEKLRARIAMSPDRSALVYIHGYNVQFDEGLHRIAQLSKDIEFSGAPILYSWPSHGQLLRYRSDESNVEWSAAHLERFLADVHQLTGVKKLHVIAHSMGNRALVGAIQLLQLRYPREQPMLSQVILAAPDMDADEFRDRYADAVDVVAKGATLYASATDRALLASMKWHGRRRLGLTSTPQPTFVGVDQVDVTPVDTSLIGHSYYGRHPLMICELSSLVHWESRPEERNWLTTLADRRNPPLWRFIPELAAEASDVY